MLELKIRTEFIKLENALKLLGLISTPGESKVYLYTCDVYVDEVIERRRGRKLYPGSTIRIGSDLYKIV